MHIINSREKGEEGEEKVSEREREKRGGVRHKDIS